MTQYAEVAVFPHRTPLVKRFPPAFTYLVPEDWPAVQAGLFVLAPFGTQSDFERLVSGVIVRVTTQKPNVPRLKLLEALLHPAPVLSPVQLELAQWLADNTVEALSNCVRLFAPPGQARHSEIEYELVQRDAELPRFSKGQADLIELLRTRGPLRAAQITAAFGQRDWKKPIARLAELDHIVGLNDDHPPDRDLDHWLPPEAGVAGAPGPGGRIFRRPGGPRPQRHRLHPTPHPRGLSPFRREGEDSQDSRKQPREPAPRDVDDLARARAGGLTSRLAPNVNLGNVHFGPGRHPVTPSVFLGDPEIEALRLLTGAGFAVEARAIPAETPTGMAEIERRYAAAR